MTSASKPLRVIVIDDSAPFRRQVANALEASGLVVAEASEGYEALWRVRAEGVFDLILADIHMPNLDGLEFIREVRRLPEYAEVPIFVITSDGSRERREEGRRAGATAWLLKPPDLPALVNTVHAALLQLIKVKDPNPPSPRPGAAPRSVTPSARRPSRAPLSSRIPQSSRAALSGRTAQSSRAPRPSLSSRAPLARPTLPSVAPERRPSTPERLVSVTDPQRHSKDPDDGSGD